MPAYPPTHPVLDVPHLSMHRSSHGLLLTPALSFSNHPAAVARGEANPAVATTYRCGSEQVTPRVENNYSIEPTILPEYVLMDRKLDNEYEVLVHKMESEYEVAGSQLGAGVAMGKPSR